MIADLIVFLLVQIAEDERIARNCPEQAWHINGHSIYGDHPTDEIIDWVWDGCAPHIATWDPARVLAECNAKRRIIELHQLDRRDAFHCETCGPAGDHCRTCWTT